MSSLAAIKTENDDFQVEYEIISPINISSITDHNKREILLALQDIDKQIDLCDDEIAKLSVEIEKLTNHADGIDYAVAVSSGILTGLIDSFFVGDYNPSVEDVVTNFAKKKSSGKINNYEDAQKYLADKYHTDHDGAYISGKDNSEKPHHVYAKTHRLDDFTHHPSILGLMATILVMYFKKNILVNRYGEAHTVDIPTSTKDIVKTWLPAVLSGLMLWIATMAEKYVEEELDAEIPQPIKKIIRLVAASPSIIQILKCAEKWYGHIMSDVATPAGIPGIFLSLLKEISSLPGINKTKLPLIVQTLYQNNKFDDFGSELAFIEKIKKQAIPVVINELLVRGFYFIRQLISEYQEHNDFVDIDWKKTFPFGNRTVERMMTIATGTFTAVDMADAAIRGALESGGTAAGFVSQFVARINFVGVGRFAIAVGVDAGMGIKRGELVNEHMKIMGRELELLNAKVYYKCAQLHSAEEDMLEAEEYMWIAAQDAERTIYMAYEMAQDSVELMTESISEIHRSMENISSYRAAVEEKNPGLIKGIVNTLKY